MTEQTNVSGFTKLADAEKVIQETPQTPVEDQGNEGEYKPPVTEELQPKELTEAPVANTGEDKKEDSKEDAEGYEVTPALVKATEMISPTGNLASNVMLARIAKHMKYLKGERGFKDEKERYEEQASFMECIGRTTTMKYEDFKLITDVLVQEIRDNLKVFTSGEAVRFIQGMTSKYPANSPVKYPKGNVDHYIHYITFLTSIARNYTTRHRLKSSIDPALVIDGLSRAGKENITLYFTQLTND